MSDKAKQAVQKVKDAHAAMGAALDRIRELERAMEGAAQSLEKMATEFSGGIYVYAFHENKWQHVHVRAVLSGLATDLKKHL